MSKDTFEILNNNSIKGSLELALLNRLFENKEINEEIYYKVKESIVKEYGLQLEGLPLNENAV